MALTRASKKINITYVNQNRYSYASHDFNSPSRFIDELPKELIEIHDSINIKNDNFIDEFSHDINSDENYISPGRRRLIQNKKNNEVDWDLNQDFNFEDSFSIEGSRVFHQKYGYGKIINFDGEKAEVNFEKSNNKKIFIKYLQFIK